jgi:cysteinyl-tRNA synthetase
MIFSKKKKEVTPLSLTNTMSGKKEVFTPLSPGKVSLYNCGPTVYSEQHIGNMRAAVFADILRRVFEYNDYTVTQVINITDVGHTVNDSEEGADKMEKKAKEEGLRAADIAENITKLYLDDLTALGVNLDAIQFPRATDYIDAQIQLTKTLIEKGYAYVIGRGVAFDTSKYSAYGKLGNIPIEDLQAGARIEEDTQKRNPADFWLWKLSEKPGERQQEWDSPWGIGFPGWHIECTAMSRAILGKQIDVHTGGIEHIPVHHNNEIAQSEALSGKTFVQYWMHNAHLMLDGKKIAKSTGHVIYLRQIIARGYNPLTLRYLLLGSKYSAEQNFTWEALDAASAALQKLRHYYAQHLLSTPLGSVEKHYKEKFLTAINDDLGTPRALAVLWELIKDTQVSPSNKKATLQDFDRVLGLQCFDDDTNTKKLAVKIDTTPDEVLELLKERKNARAAKDWAKADTLRDKIAEHGYKVTDLDDEQKISPL